MRRIWTAGAWFGLGLLATGCGSMARMGGMPSPMMANRSYGMTREAMPEPAAMNTEAYAHLDENPFMDPKRAPLSTFGVDVDTASYSNVRRFLMAEHRLPPKDAVRLEEMVNYFHYDYPEPSGDAPFSVTTDVAACPWEPTHALVRVGLQGKRIAAADVPPRNLVFLIDVSGSMDEPNKLPLVVRAMRMLADQLTDKDSVAVVVYAGTEGLALPPTPGDRHDEIKAAIDNLSAGGSTNGGAGIQLAYKVAREHFRAGGINRVILATDGDFNVGVSSEGELQRLIEDERKSGVFLSVLGVGTGNVKDSTMEMLADKGNGNYAYLDSDREAKKVLVEQAGSTLVTIAKDVKVQVEFNPARVGAYRLLGYEDRALRAEDFKDDTKDAGDIGAGHSVTALYEIVPPGAPAPTGSVDPLKYQTAGTAQPSPELLTVKLRYKQPDADTSNELAFPLTAPEKVAPIGEAPRDLRFAAAVAEFGMLLRASPNKESATFASARALAQEGVGEDPQGYRAELLKMIDAASQLTPASQPVAR